MKIKKENIMNRFLKMNRFFKSSLIGSAGLIILAVTLSFTAPGRTVAQVAEDCIRICNTASSPIHVITQGITRITGAVTINNENAIATTVTGPVEVTTSPREPLYVIQRKKMDNIFQKQVSLTLKPGDTSETQDFVVPAGKFLEIKYASGTATIKGGAVPVPVGWFYVKIRVIQPNNSDFVFYLPKDFQGVSYANNVAFASYQVGGNLVGIFGDSGGTVQVRLERFFVPPPAEIKLELAITGEYHDF